MNKKYIYILFCLMMLITSTKAQEINYRHYNLGEDLDCKQIYTHFEDSEGYLWLGTDNGIIKYNGIAFKHYGIENGLVSRNIYNIGEFKNGLLWFASLGSVTFFNEESFYPAPFNDSLSKFKDLRLFNINLVSDTTFIISTSTNGVLQYNNGFSEIRDVIEGSFVGRLGVQAGYFYHNGERYSLPRPKGKSIHGLEILPVNDSLVLFSINGILYEFNKNTLKINFIHEFEDKILYINKDWEDKVWLAIPYKGIFQYNTKTSKLMNFQSTILEKKVIAGFNQSIDGGYWISTLNNGLYYFPNLDVKYINNPNIHQHSIKKVITNDSSIFIATQNSYIAEIYKNKVKKKSDFQLEFRDFAFNQEGDLCYTINKQGTFNYRTKKKLGGSFRRILFMSRYKMFGLSGDDMYEINPSLLKPLSVSKKKISAWSICKKNENEILIGTVDGLWKYTVSENDFDYLGDKHPILKTPIQNVFSNGKISIVSTQKGIIIKKEKQLLTIDESDGLINNLCNHAFMAADTSIWMSTNKGISRIRNIFDAEKREFLNLSIEDGLSSNVIFNACELNDTIYIATSLGVNYFHKDLQPFQYSYKLYIDSIEINKTNRNIEDFYQLNSNENLIKFNFHTISYKKEDNLEYQYRLSPTDSLWTTTTDRFIMLSSLQPGDYYLEIRVKNNNPNLKSVPKKIHFHINSPIYQQWWFILLAFLVILIVFYIISRYRIKQLRTKQEMETELNNTRQESLSSQMNPHFIFNSLNSIQRFVLISDKRNASKFISQFSKLMRLILDNSKHRLITIEEEIKALNLYLELEVLRFKDKISYSIIIDPTLNVSSYKIPPLLIQPFVENAIWHGIMHKNGSGKIVIHFKEHEKKLCCIIEDDGIGRKERAKIKENNRVRNKSFGMDITAQRIDLGKKLYGQNFSFQIIDLINENNKVMGTRVELTIPKITAE